MACPATQTDNRATTYHCTTTHKRPALPCSGCRPPKWCFHPHKFSVFNRTLEGEEGGGGVGTRPQYQIVCLWRRRRGMGSRGVPPPPPMAYSHSHTSLGGGFTLKVVLAEEGNTCRSRPLITTNDIITIGCKVCGGSYLLRQECTVHPSLPTHSPCLLYCTLLLVYTRLSPAGAPVGLYPVVPVSSSSQARNFETWRPSV